MTTDDRTNEPKRVPPTHAAGDMLGRALNVAVSGFAFGFLGHWIGTKVGAADVLAVIDEENARPHPDDIHIATLKKQKLQIKDELAQLSSSH